MRELGDLFPSGVYVIRPRPAAAEVGFSQLRQDAEQVLARIVRREGLR